MLTSRQSAGVAPEVNLSNSAQARKHARNPPWLWNLGQMSLEVQNRDISGPMKRTYVLQTKNLKKHLGFNYCSNTKFMFVSQGPFENLSLVVIATEHLNFTSNTSPVNWAWEPRTALVWCSWCWELCSRSCSPLASAPPGSHRSPSVRPVVPCCSGARGGCRSPVAPRHPSDPEPKQPIKTLTALFTYKPTAQVSTGTISAVGISTLTAIFTYKPKTHVSTGTISAARSCVWRNDLQTLVWPLVENPLALWTAPL